MIHENLMLQLHGKTHTKWVFQKKPHVFTILHFFVKNNKGIAQRNNCQSWEYDGFDNTWEACAQMKKTLPAVSESTRFSAILRGNKKAKARADEGSERCCCCCCCGRSGTGGSSNRNNRCSSSPLWISRVWCASRYFAVSRPPFTKWTV